MGYKRRRVIAISVWLSLVVVTGQAATISGTAIEIVDGHSITVVDDEHTQHRIRVLGINAPAMARSFGEHSRQNMVRMVAGKQVIADCHKIDHRKGLLCKVWVQPAYCPECGKTLDVGHAQIIAGLACWNRQHANEQSLEDRGRYESAEQEARLRKFGLWRDYGSVSPWE